MRWLQLRKLAGRPMLRVKLVDCAFLSDEDVDYHDEDGCSWKPYSLSHFYDLLRNICVLGVEGISLMTKVVLLLSSSSPLQLVCYGFIREIGHSTHSIWSRFCQIYRIFSLAVLTQRTSQALHPSRGAELFPQEILDTPSHRESRTRHGNTSCRWILSIATIGSQEPPYSGRMHILVLF